MQWLMWNFEFPIYHHETDRLGSELDSQREALNVCHRPVAAGLVFEPNDSNAEKAVVRAQLKSSRMAKLVIVTLRNS